MPFRHITFWATTPARYGQEEETGKASAWTASGLKKSGEKNIRQKNLTEGNSEENASCNYLLSAYILQKHHLIFNFVSKLQ